jgi:hypothetical protein
MGELLLKLMEDALDRLEEGGVQGLEKELPKWFDWLVNVLLEKIPDLLKKITKPSDKTDSSVYTRWHGTSSRSQV